MARRYNQRSQLGVVLDPIADKGLLLAAIITLSFSNWTYEFPIWFPVLVITRDAVILIGTALLHYLVGKVHGKAKLDRQDCHRTANDCHRHGAVAVEFLHPHRAGRATRASSSGFSTFP